MSGPTSEASQGHELHWRERNQYYWITDCGRYTVERTQSFAEDPKGEWIYLAWCRSTDPKGTAADISPKRRKTLETAQCDCARHLQKATEAHAAADVGGLQRCA